MYRVFLRGNSEWQFSIGVIELISLIDKSFSRVFFKAQLQTVNHFANVKEKMTAVTLKATGFPLRKAKCTFLIVGSNPAGLLWIHTPPVELAYDHWPKLAWRRKSIFVRRKFPEKILHGNYMMPMRSAWRSGFSWGHDYKIIQLLIFPRDDKRFGMFRIWRGHSFASVVMNSKGKQHFVSPFR